jgi:hypothetical protein
MTSREKTRTQRPNKKSRQNRLTASRLFFTDARKAEIALLVSFTGRQGGRKKTNNNTQRDMITERDVNAKTMVREA